MKVCTLNTLKEIKNNVDLHYVTKEATIDLTNPNSHLSILNTNILNISEEQYQQYLYFDTELIVSGGASSSVLGVGLVGTIILGTA